MTVAAFILSAVLATAGKSGVELTIESEETKVDPAQSLFLTVRLVSPRGLTVDLPDLRERVVGFSLAEDFAEDPVIRNDGSTLQTAMWRLVPEACADIYKIRPFAIAAHGIDFIVPAIYFENPPAREPVTGEMECEAKKDFPPLSWKLVGQIALGLLGICALVAALYFAVRFLFHKVKEHRMSPIERAYFELDRLIKKGLPGRGRYKDFYVELTMVVRRYIQRKYGIKAPHLTTEEFLREFKSDALRSFLESADLVKFAGVEATPEMADEATSSARDYLESDNVVR